MDWNRLEGDWKQLRGKAKEKWGKLTDDDLTAISGRPAQLEGKIQARYGYAKSQARKEIEDWYRSTESLLAERDRQDPNRDSKSGFKRRAHRQQANWPSASQGDRGCT